MKQLLIAIAALVLVGCGESQQMTPAEEAKPVDSVVGFPAQPPSPVESQPAETVTEAVKPESPTVKAPDISIHQAARDGNIETVKQHLAAGTDVNAIDENRGITPLVYAAREGHKKIVELLIADGADVNAKRGNGLTPLHSVANNAATRPVRGHKEVAEMLIAKGADVNAKDNQGRTPLDAAIFHKDFKTEVAELLRKHGGISGAEDSVHVAAELGNIEAVKQHLAAGTDVNAKDDEFEVTSLHLSARRGHKEITELLIAKGADVNANDNRGATPLDAAIMGKRTETSDLLRKHGGKTAEELKAEGK